MFLLLMLMYVASSQENRIKHIIKNKEVLTKRVKFSDLPLKFAIKTVHGNGKRVIAVFEDPNCCFCKYFYKTLQKIDNVTIYTFQYNIVAPDSIKKSHDIWCAVNQNQALNEWMLNNKLTTNTKKKGLCNSPHETVLLLGNTMNVMSIPTSIFIDGSRILGAVDAQTLEKKFITLE